ncbi:ABC transporter substrate-binding protein [Pseudomonas gingeri]|uniref:ABC transporter substrate-binding protein n=1 Tax=Pseudomonas gingeri TaxID=117681 RepID=UPI00159FCD8A|nr:ABC transporter substrate-binding protein [Pseudomonas gingeri]NWA05827.1 ABC transporter substrate-binding protein [Pseudomonas gingeri]
MHRRTLIQLFAAASCAGLFPPLLRAETGAPPKPGGTLKIALMGLDTSDPHRHAGSISVQQVYVEALTSVANDGTVKPFLAERFDLSDDGKVYTFYLRDNVKFHNGRTLTAQDVKANLERVRDKISGGWLSNAMKLVSDMSVPSPQVLRVELKETFAPLLSLLSELWIVAPESEGWNDTIRQPIGTGPFTFGTWQANQRLFAPAFKQYWQPGLPYLDAIDFDLRGDRDNSLSLRSGDLHVAYVNNDRLPSLRDDNIEVQFLGDTSWYFLSFNNRKPNPLLQDMRVRKAIALSIDKTAYMGFIGGKDAMISNQPTRPDTFYWDQALEQKDTFAKPDMERARKLLQSAGVEAGQHTLKVVSWQADYAQVAVQMVRELGFRIDHQALDDIGAQRLLGQYDWDLAPFHSGPRADVYLRYARLQSQGPSPMLWGGIQDPELDRLIALAVDSPSLGLARERYLAAWQLVMDKFYTLGIGHSADAIGVAANVHGYRTGYTWSQNRVDGGLARTWLSA